jgi:hypothetical protein
LYSSSPSCDPNTSQSLGTGWPCDTRARASASWCLVVRCARMAATEPASALSSAVAIFETDLEADRDAEARDVPFTDGFNQGADDAAAIRFLNDVNTGGDASVRFERAEFDRDDRAKHEGEAEAADAAGIAVERQIPPSPYGGEVIRNGRFGDAKKT